MTRKESKNPSTSVLKFGVCFIPVFLLVTLLYYVAGPIYVRILLPLFAFEIEMVHSEYEVISSGIENLNNSDHIYYVIKIKRPIVNKLGIPKYDKTVKLNIVASTLYIQPIIIFSLLFSWPGLSLREKLKAALIAVPFLIATASIDIPPFFVSRIEMSFPVGSLSEQIRIMLLNFFSNGGRQFLALLVALVIIGLIRIMRTSTAISDLDPNDLCPCGSGKKYKRCCMK